MGMKALKCPYCGADIELDESIEYGFCSYCGTKIQLSEHINANAACTQEQNNPGLLWQKARNCMDSATIDNDNVTEALIVGKSAIEKAPAERRRPLSDQLVQMYTICIARLGREMLAAIKTYNKDDRNSIAVFQTHNVLKSLFVAPNYFPDCSLMAIEELENTAVSVCNSLGRWAKNAAKLYNGNQMYYACIQNKADDMRNTMPNTEKTGGGRKQSKVWYKRWSFWILFGILVILGIIFYVRERDGLLFNWVKNIQNVSVDYPNVKGFEADLNAGKDLTGKTVTFKVTKLVPNSEFGYNMQTGEHLNFCSSSHPGAQTGDTVTVKVTEIESFLGSYIIRYKMIK